jgi:hypothetical protein
VLVKKRNIGAKADLVTSITSSGGLPGQDARTGETAMQKIALWILALTFVAGSVVTYRAAAKPVVPSVQVQQLCKGLDCWPTVPVKQPRSARLGLLPPVW